MDEQFAINKIRQIRNRSILFRLLTIAIYAFAVALPVAICLNISLLWPLYWIALLFAVFFTAIIFFKRALQLSEVEIADFINQNYAGFEESCNLALLPKNELNFLQQLQLNKISAVFHSLPLNQPVLLYRLKIALFTLLGSICLSFLIFRFSKTLAMNLFSDNGKTGKKLSVKPEKILAQISKIEIFIKPPPYTRLIQQQQDKFTLEIPEGSTVKWMLETNIAVKQVIFIFNQNQIIILKSSKDKTHWFAQKTIDEPGFYQVIIDGKQSDLYQVQIIKDMAPLIQISSPKQYTYIDAGERSVISLNVSITDDYGVSNAFINATVAKGSGEGVKFKEQKFDFSQNFGKNEKKYELQKTIDLKALGMEPGDEFYFYIQATDNNRHTTRTDVYIVSIQDTAQLMSLNGLAGAVNIKPEYFRSERQIIIDSQNLLKDKDSISVQKFRERSNELGTDQKLLRLRYGKFLGEESENEISDPTKGGKDEVLSDPKDFGNGAKILDEYTDKHDNAEDAQFFEPAVKAQLKATLTEMWKAELQLRLYKPEDALPFEFKALRLLKDLQEKSRSYVAKTAYNPAPLKLEKRLTGELSKIIPANQQTDIVTNTDQFEALKKTVLILNKYHDGSGINQTENRDLQAAYLLLSNKAIAQPAIYLASVTALQKILRQQDKNYKIDVMAVEHAAQQLLPEQNQLPQNNVVGPDMGLSKSYFLKLKNLNR